ncbi:hypothetical protein RUM44_000963 [Polyplax serrata]|uniref:Uncharacterized protein n=1 Tax=Polyplax serrata TaxID=468196 RepID=A0ABR1B941_POLSC
MLFTSDKVRNKTCDQKGGSAHKGRRRRNSDQNEIGSTLHKEDLENKGNKKRTNNRGTKKKILEEANNSKLRDVQVRVEDCLQAIRKFPGLSANEEIGDTVVSESSDKDESAVNDSPRGSRNSERKSQGEEETLRSPDEPEVACTEILNTGVKGKEKCSEKAVVESVEERTSEAAENAPVEVISDRRTRESESTQSEENSKKDGDDEDDGNTSKITRSTSSSTVVVKSNHDEAGPPVITSAPECNSVDDDGPLSRSSPFRMDDAAGTAVSRFPDDRSDSGVSSFRSGSGDERSGSRSSALSISDEPQSQLQSSTTQPTNRSPLFIPTNSSHSSDKSNSEPVRIWRDPSLAAEPRVRHVQSVQHQTLLMSHPPPASAPQPPANNSTPSVSPAQQALALAQAQTAHYPPVPPPPLLSPHPLHVPLPPPGLYSQLPEVLWKQRYPPLPVAPHLLGPAHTAAEELLERERAFFQDKDRLLR